MWTWQIFYMCLFNLDAFTYGHNRYWIISLKHVLDYDALAISIFYETQK